MGLINWAEKKIQKLNIWEFALTKTVLILFGIMMGAYISTFVKQNITILIIVFVAGYAILIYKVFKKKV